MVPTSCETHPCIEFILYCTNFGHTHTHTTKKTDLELWYQKVCENEELQTRIVQLFLQLFLANNKNCMLRSFRLCQILYTCRRIFCMECNLIHFSVYQTYTIKTGLCEYVKIDNSHKTATRPAPIILWIELGGTLTTASIESTITQCNHTPFHMNFSSFTVWSFKVSRDSFGSNRMCQFFLSKPIFMVQAFRKWNKLGGHHARFFRKWVRILLFRPC